MILHHYHDQPVILDRSWVYDQSEKTWRGGKPNGLWVSVVGEDDWASWCRGEEFALGDLAVTHEVVLDPAANILHLKSPEEIDRFHREYAGEVPEWYRRDDRRQDRFMFGQEYVDLQRPIEWNRVADEYQGLIIAPYQWERRLGGPFWYYGFDCASGCIWDLSAIAEFSVAEDITEASA